tara:strand:- start:551 stop:1957 length:1407 start_codon:yes stop_codon:yes gene_type:complete
MPIKITEKQLKRMNKILNEAPPIDYGDRPERMDPDLENKLGRGDFPGAGNKSFPSVDPEGVANTFEELVASKRFKDVVDTVKRYTGVEEVSQNSFQNLGQMMMGAFSKIQQIESENKEELQDLSVRIVKEYLAIPDDAFQYEVKLKGLGDIDQEGMQMKPNQNQSEEQKQNAAEEAVEEFEDFDIEKEKRRFMNMLMQGAAKKGHYLYHMVAEELGDIHPDLLNLYGVMMSINDLVYWIMPDQAVMKQAEGGEGMGGKEEIDPDTDPPTIKVEGVAFPILVHELIKGVMEVLGTQGLPDDPRHAEMVMDSEDTLTAEVWDLRLGPVIWEKFREAYPKNIMEGEFVEVQNYLFSEFARMDSNEFFELAKKILSGSEEGRSELVRIVDGIIKEMGSEGEERDDYEMPGYKDTMDSLDKLTIFGDETEPTPKSTSEPVYYDMDDILGKIFDDGMDSLTKGEKDFLMNQGKS